MEVCHLSRSWASRLWGGAGAVGKGLGAGGNKCLMGLGFGFCGEIYLHKIYHNYF